MTTLRNFLVGALVAPLAAAGCGGDTLVTTQLPDLGTQSQNIGQLPTDDLANRWRGQSEFESLIQSWGWGGIRTASAMGDAKGESSAVTRSVEDSDIYQVDTATGLLYVLNAYRGLQILDVSNADAPVMVGRAALGGYPVEMYRKGDYAYVLLNSLVEQGPSANPDDNFTGSVLRVYDVSNPAAIEATAEFKISGYMRDSRLLAADDGSSTVIYVMSNVWDFQTVGERSEWFETSYVMSIDVTDVTNPREIERVNFPGAGQNGHVTQDAIFVSGYDWETDLSTVQYVDISDLGGDIQVRGKIDFQGNLTWGDRGDLQLDYLDGTLRVASSVRGLEWNTGFVRLTTIDAQNPDAMAVLDTLDMGDPGHRIVAARFDGAKAYLFHMINVDPLEIVDLANPADIKSAGILKINGWVNHIEARGDKLVTLGVNDAEDRKIAMIMFDVKDAANPVELSRVAVGEGWTWTNANHDIKSFRLIDKLGLAILPVSSSSWSEDGGYKSRTWLQFFSYDLAAGTITARGEVDGMNTQRTFPVADRIMALGDTQLQVIDATNADAPRVTAEFELARNVVDFVKVAGFGVMLVEKGDWNTKRNSEFRVVSLDAPDDSAAIATLALDHSVGRLFQLDATTLVTLGSDVTTGETLLNVISFKSVLKPAIVGSLRTSALGQNRFNWFQSSKNNYGRDVVLSGKSLAVTGYAQDENLSNTVSLVSLKNPKAPYIAETFALGTGNVVDMKSVDNQVFVSSYENIVIPALENIVPSDIDPTLDDTTTEPTTTEIVSDVMSSRASVWWPSHRVSLKVKYSLTIIDTATPDAPVASARISVPGKFVGTATYKDDGFSWTLLYTMDSFKSDVAVVATQTTLDVEPAVFTPETFVTQAGLDTLALIGDEAFLLDVYNLPEGIDNVIGVGNKAFFFSRSAFRGFGGFGPFAALEATTATTDEPLVEERPALNILDLSRPDSIELVGKLEFATNSWSQLLAVEQGFAFLSTGNGLEVVDVSNVSAPSLLGRFPLISWWGGAMTVSVDGRAYLPSGLYGLQTIELE